MFVARKSVWVWTLVAMVAMSSTALGAATEFRAFLEGNGAPRAEGRALWQADGPQWFFSITVTDITTTDVVSVHIDGRLVGYIEIQEDGFGQLEMGASESEENLRVQAGSTIAVHDAVHANAQLPLLSGRFRGR